MVLGRQWWADHSRNGGLSVDREADTATFWEAACRYPEYGPMAKPRIVVTVKFDVARVLLAIGALLRLFL